jgi:hypothetical protein
MLDRKELSRVHCGSTLNDEGLGTKVWAAHGTERTNEGGQLETVLTDHDLYHDSVKDKVTIVIYDTHEWF